MRRHQKTSLTQQQEMNNMTTELTDNQTNKIRTPSRRILILHRLIHRATDLQLYSVVKLYCNEILNDIALLERDICEQRNRR